MPNYTSQTRPPIVAILGHVDHGKTSLLDRIRNTTVASTETGGITQSIGAWQAKTEDNKIITFIDTPGHEAFHKMRSRGAQIADIAILVVAADDGVMPQTVESLNYLIEAQTPFIVAITKVDLPGAQVESVKAQLAQKGILLEGRGGDVICMEVSSVTGKGIKELLEMILLVAEVQEIKGTPELPLEAVVIEAKLDSRRGPVATVIVKNGTLSVSQTIYSEGNLESKVKGLFNEHQKNINEALPGTPVEILGFSSLPLIGSTITNIKPEKIVKTDQVFEKRIKNNLEDDKLPIILKADNAGSYEAIVDQLGSIVRIMSGGIGDIIDSDIKLASNTGSIVIGFNIKAGKDIQKLSDEEKVPIHTYKILYDLLKDVEKWIQEKKLSSKEQILGKATIIAQFQHDKEKIAGCKLETGRIAKNDKLKLVRDNVSLGNIRLISLKKAKNEVDKVNQNEEFGAYFKPQLDFKIGDTIESYLEPRVDTP